MNSDRASTSSSDERIATRAEYLARVAAHLHPLTESDRRNILDELRSHIAERYGDWAEADAVAAVMRDLGSPEDYAAAFIAAYGVSTAPPRLENRRRVFLRGIGIALAILSFALFLFAVLNVLTPAAAQSGWLRWRDIGLGRNGWVAIASVSAIVAAAAAVAARTLLRPTFPPE